MSSTNPNKKIFLDTATQLQTGAYASYNFDDNKLIISSFGTANLKLETQFAQTLSAAAHEMYHAFQDIFWKTPNTWDRHVQVELDAHIFGAKVLEQYTVFTGGAVNYGLLSGYGSFSNNPSQNGGAAFKSAWEDIISGDFSIEKYNTLVAGFQSTAFNHNGNYTWLQKQELSMAHMQINKVLYNDGAMIVTKYSPEAPIIIIDFDPYDPYQMDWGSDWDDSDPFNNPFDYGYDSDYGSFGAWFDFNSTDYDGDYGNVNTNGSNPGTGGDAYHNDTGFNQWWYNESTGSWYDLPGGYGDVAPDGFKFVESQDPNNPYAYDESGIDPNGYNTDGYNAEGFDRQGYDQFGLDETGFDRDGFDGLGYDEEGFTRDGLDSEGYDRNGEDVNGNTREENGDY